MEGTIKSQFVSPELTKSRRCRALVPINPTPPGAPGRMKTFSPWLMKSTARPACRQSSTWKPQKGSRFPLNPVPLCRVYNFALAWGPPRWVPAAPRNSSHLPKLRLCLFKTSESNPTLQKRTIFDAPEGVFSPSMSTHTSAPGTCHWGSLPTEPSFLSLLNKRQHFPFRKRFGP